MTATRILLGIAALLAFAGVASAQSACPECDEDGTGSDGAYHSADGGVVDENTTALVDTDVSHGDGGEDGFWLWMSLCIHAFLGHIEEMLGVDTGVDGNVETYDGEDGGDVDATLHVGDQTFDFDESPLGDLDGETWGVMDEANEVLPETPDTPALPDYGSVDEDVCTGMELLVVSCG